MSNIDHMLASIIGKDKEAFSSAFADEMRERLATSIVDKDLNISQSLLSNDEEIASEEVEEAVTDSVSIINAVKEACSSEIGVPYTLKDSQLIHILPEDADSIIQIHDTLNAENQVVLRDMLSETEESYQKVLNFCNKKAQ